ncbi:hypothetical protein KRP22_011679 [Phytophthora ramorum]|nr:Hydroxycinnamoyltransferase 2 [Phytophthora ramorum]
MVNVVAPADIEVDVLVPLSPLDTVMNTYRIVILYIYPPPSRIAASYNLEKLHRSFNTLVDEDYPMLVGALHYDEKTGAASVKQTSLARKRGASGIRFETNHTSCQSTDDAIASLSWDFMPKTRTSGEIIAVKGSILADGGMAIGVDCSHVLFDGEAMLTFMRLWGQHYSGVSTDDRLVINHNRYLLSGMGEQCKLPHPEFQIAPADPLIRREDGSLAPKAVTKPPKTAEHVFHLSPSNMAKLKKMAESAQEAIRPQDQNKPSSQPAYVSTVDVITALFTILISRARGHGQDVRVSTAVNGRKRLEPSLPANYSGNAVFHALSSYTNEELSDGSGAQKGVSASTLGRVARSVRASILERDDAFMRDTVAFLASQTDPSTINDNVNFFFGPDVAFTCWAKMGLYDAEFDGTKPSYAKIPRVQCMDGFVLITETVKGGDGLDVLVCLESTAMNKLVDLYATVQFLQDVSP